MHVTSQHPRRCRALARHGLVTGLVAALLATFGLSSPTSATSERLQAEAAVFPEGAQYSSPWTSINSVSCASPGNCTAVGQFQNPNNTISAFTMTSTNGVWTTGRPVVFDEGTQSSSPNANLFSVSCASSGNCTAVGIFTSWGGGHEAFTMTSTNGIWANARPAIFDPNIQNENVMANFNSVSCAAAGNCTAVGYFRNAGGDIEAFTMTSTDGTWANAQPAVFADGVQYLSPSANFNSVSCASAGNCTAVGYFTNADGNHEAFTMTSTDGTWANAQPAVFADGVQHPSPNTTFYSVSCTSPGNCTAVGQFTKVCVQVNRDTSYCTNGAFTMTSTNGEWTQARPAEFPEDIQHPRLDSNFTAVSCVSPGNCTAVGQFTNVDLGNEAFTMTSTNGEWTQARPAEFNTGIQNSSPRANFNSVSCASSGNCTAVGQFSNAAGDFVAITMTSTDGTWANAQPAEFNTGIQSSSPYSSFASVSCASAGNCTAVGTFTNVAQDSETFTMTSTNGGWTQPRSVLFPEDVVYKQADFTAVSCASPGNCTAIGNFRNARHNYEAFTMTSTNGTWAKARPAEFNTGIQSFKSISSFSSVSCASPGNCTAVGYFRNAGGDIVAFTMTSTNGTWAKARPAEFNTGIQNTTPKSLFNSVSCASPGNCTAVGNFLAGDDWIAFTMTSTNGEWTQARPAEFPDSVVYVQAFFNSVSCTSAGNCTAVGSFQHEIGKFASGTAFTMTSTNGEWTQARPAEFENDIHYADFSTVSCASAGNCTAIGNFTITDNFPKAFTMTSTNGVWAKARPAEFENDIQNEIQVSEFNSVSCASAGNCTAVGDFHKMDGPFEAFTMTSTNGVWAKVRPAQFDDPAEAADPNSPFAFGTFSSVSCTTAGNCTAVGQFSNVLGFRGAITMASTNGVWAKARSIPFPDGLIYQDSTFTSVSCTTQENCTAVGGFTSVTASTGAVTLTLVNTSTSETTSPTTTPTTTATTPTTSPTTTPTTPTTSPTTTPTTPTTTSPTTPTTTTTPRTTPTTTTTAPQQITSVPAPKEEVVLSLPIPTKPLLPNTSLTTGAPVSVTFSGFVPGEYVQLIVASTPRVIASGYADRNGSITLTGDIPASLLTGNHSVVLYAPVSGIGVRQPFTVTAHPSSLPRTGASITSLLQLAVCSLLFGLMLLAWARRRNSTQSQ